MEIFQNEVNTRKPVYSLIIPNVDQHELLLFLQKVPNKGYVRQVLRKYFRTIPESDIIGEMFEFYTTTLSAPEPGSTPDKDILTYSIGDRQIKIIENPVMVSDQGVTGIRTWEASVFAAQWLNANCIRNANGDKTKIHGKIVEIGCGTGLVGMSLLPSKVVFTDMDLGVLNTIQKTIAANPLDWSSNGMDYTQVMNEEDFKDPFEYNLGLMQLCWGTWSTKCDYVIGSDITYDTSILPELILCLQQFLEKGAVGIISATVRQPQTIAEWERLLNKFDWQILHQDKGIKIYRIEIKQ